MYERIDQHLIWLGVKDFQSERFENWFPVEGMHYHSYLLRDQKTVLLDTVDSKFITSFLFDLDKALAGKSLDYLVISHMEPDHTGAIVTLLQRYPKLILVGTRKTMALMEQFFALQIKERFLTVQNQDRVVLGKLQLIFYSAPMLHWPEVMLSYCPEKQLLFSADAFGSFGAYPQRYTDELTDFTFYLSEMRRYYSNIIGKYGSFVQQALQNLKALPIKAIYPLHGLFWRKDFTLLLDYYHKWSNYLPEKKGVLILFASIYGHTEEAAKLLAHFLNDSEEVKIINLTTTHRSQVLAETWKYSHIILASPTYNNGLFDAVEDFLRSCVSHQLQNRTFALIENGSWAPRANELANTIIQKLPNSHVLSPNVTIHSALKEGDRENLEELAKHIKQSIEVL